MIRSNIPPQLDFTSRQLASLLARENVQDAFAKLRRACPEHYGREIDYLQELFESPALATATDSSSPLATMARLLPKSSKSRTDFFRAFIDYVQQSKVIFETYWAGVVGQISYLGSLAAVALVAAIVFGVFVLPSFAEMFTRFGSALPTFTQTVFSMSGFGIPLFAVGLIVVAAVIIWFVALFHRKIQQLQPLPGWPRSIPIVGPLAAAYNYGLFLNFARMLRQSGATADEAISRAAMAANHKELADFSSLTNRNSEPADLPELAELSIAAKLGHLDEELVHQCDHHIGRLSLRLVEARDRFSLVLKLFMYIFVSTLVVAMYLPIFKMGSVV